MMMISPHATDDDDFSSFSRLPDEIVLQIVNKLFDLKTLCVCQLLSKRFYLIVHQIDVVSFDVPRFGFRRDVNRDSYFLAVSYIFRCKPFQSAIESMNKFRCLKSLSVKLPFPSQEGVVIDGNRYLFKAMVKLGNYRIDSFLILSPNSISCQTDSNEVGHDLGPEKFGLSLFSLFMDAAKRTKLLFRLITTFPLLEEVSITDSDKMLTLSLSGSKLLKMRKWRLSSSPKQDYNMFSYRTSKCYIPLLELPVSGYVMKGLTLIFIERGDLPDGHDSFHNIFEEDAFEGKDEAAYNEAMTEIFKIHKGKHGTYRY